MNEDYINNEDVKSEVLETVDKFANTKSEEDEFKEPPENTLGWEKGLYVLRTRSGKVYRLEEQSGKVFSQARKVSTMIKKTRQGETEETNTEMMYNILIIKSCVEPVLKQSTFNLDDLPGSESLMLRKAIMDLYSMDAFL